jgi:hypothetical protein
MSTFQNIAIGDNPESGLKFVPAGFPTRPLLIYDIAGNGSSSYYIDPRDDQFHLRKVDITKPGPFDLAVGSSFGRFNEQIDGAVVHPNGYIVGFNASNCKIEVLPLEAKPGADKDAPVANLYSGYGSRPGLIHNPAGIAVNSDGVVLLLENAAWRTEARVQAMDYLANPVKCFYGKQSSILNLKAEGNKKQTFLDIGTEVGGYIYVLKYLGDGARIDDYRLDIYEPNGSFVTQTVAVNAGRLAVSLWRELFTANFNVIAGPGGRTEPSVSEWFPSTPSSNA